MMICISGLQNGGESGLKAKIRALSSYGIFEVNHDFIACNDALALNSVQDSIASLEHRRNHDYEHKHGVSRPPELAARLADRNAAVNDKNGLCPVKGYDNQLVADDREFHGLTKQWVCKTCKSRSLYHNNELTPADTRPLRISAKDLSGSGEDTSCGVNWYSNNLVNEEGKLRRLHVLHT